MEGTREALIGGVGWDAIGSEMIVLVVLSALALFAGVVRLPRRAGARAPEAARWGSTECGIASTACSSAARRRRRCCACTASSCSRRAAAGPPGCELGDDLIADETRAAVNELAVPGLLARVRAAWDGPLVLMKGPEVALDYRAPGLRSFGDLDLLTDDAEAAQAALIAAGFHEVFDPEIYKDIHHLRPLWWPGLPLVVELHSRAELAGRVPRPVDRRAARRRRAGPARRRPGVDDPAARAPHAGAGGARVGAPAARAARQPDRRGGDAAAERSGRGRGARPPLGLLAAVAHDARRDAGGARRRGPLGRGRAVGAAPARGARAHGAASGTSRTCWPRSGPCRRHACRDRLAEVEPLRARAASRGGRSWPRSRLALRNAGTARSEHDLALEATGTRRASQGGGMTELRLRGRDLHWREIDGEVIALEVRGSPTWRRTAPARCCGARSPRARRARPSSTSSSAAYGIDRARALADTDALRRAAGRAGPARRVAGALRLDRPVYDAAMRVAVVTGVGRRAGIGFAIAAAAAR